MTLSQTLSSFSIGGTANDYYIDVLNFASMSLFSGIPGSIINPFAFYLVPWFRRRFSTRFLYIFSQYIDGFLQIPVYFLGIIGGKHNGLYKRVLPMLIILAIKESVFMIFYGVRRVIPNEMYNEAMDYCEWRNGYRTEAMTSVAKGLAQKLAAIVSGLLSLQIKKWIGYDITLYTRGEAQTDNAKLGLFQMCTIIPSITSLFGIIPMLFYDLAGEKRERMYAELLARRDEASRKATNGDKEALQQIAKEQLEIGNQQRTL